MSIKTNGLNITHKLPYNKPNNSCSLCERGIKPKKYIYIQIKDENGMPLDKYYRVIQDGKLHKKLC